MTCGGTDNRRSISAGPNSATMAIVTAPVATGHLPVRLLGMGVSGLDDTGQVQGMLFDGEERRKQSSVDAVADQIKERFGTGALRRGSSIQGESPRTP